MDKKTTRFGTSDAHIINDLGLKNKIIDFIFSSIDLSNYRYNMLSNIQRLQFLKDNEHYVTPNFMGYNYLLLFLTIDGDKYSVAVDKKNLSYHKNQVHINKVNMYKLLINASSSVFKGTIFDCKLINYSTNVDNKTIYKYFMLINDCFYLAGNKIVDLEMQQKISHIDNVIKHQFTSGAKCKNFVFKINKLNTYDELKYLIEDVIPKCNIKCQGLVFYPKYSGINVVYLDKKQDKVLINSNNKVDNTIESKSYDLIFNMINYLKCREYSYESSGKFKKLWLKNTEIPDVYYVHEEVDEENIGIAHIPNLKISHMCNEQIHDSPVKFNCIYDKSFKKWIPISC
jgi:hypothetical protein